MRKLFILLLFFISLFANGCFYDLNIKIDDGKIIGFASIDFNKSIEIDASKAKIFNIKDGYIELSEYPKYKKFDKKPITIEFLYKNREKKDIAILEPWYPKVEKRCKYRVKIDTKDYIPITQYTFKNKDIFIFDKPLSTLYLFASKDYVVNSKKIDDLKISTYFYKKDSNLSSIYIKKSFEYFDIYKNMFGFLPYKIFNIVEIPYPVAYSLATMTILPKQIIDKKYLINRSLAHEIVHQYFGNYLFSPSFGNWCEGLATYFSDYYLSKNKRAFRKEQLIKYNSYSNIDEIPLIEFRYKDSEDKNIVGYNKGFYFFYMLKNLVGEDIFKKGIKELLKKYSYKEISYEDIRRVFEKNSKRSLKRFFLDWIYRKGAYDFDIKNIEVGFDKDRYFVSFDLVSNEYDIKMPLEICSEKKCKKFYIDSNKTKHKLFVDFEPKKIVVDRDYEIFRRLKKDEYPPVISKAFGSRDLLVVSDKKDYKEVFKEFKNVKNSESIKFEDLKDKNLLIFGKSSIIEKIAIKFKNEGRLKVEAFKNPLNNKKVIVVIDGEKEYLKRFKKVAKYFGRYSKVVFYKERIEKSIKHSKDGAIYKTDFKDAIVKVEKKRSFKEILKELKNSKVIFIGENHPVFSHHINQLKIIKSLYKEHKKLAIGLEMFQRPYQKYLDLFIEGKIGEKEMLKRSEYFKRWGYDYNLYRPILLFAKKNKIKLVALNIKKEINQKIAKEGIDSLSKKELKYLPKSIDFSNRRYRKYIKEIFNSHAKNRFKDFENFYYSQLIWDESMAESIYNFLKDKKDYKMVVLAGNGHLRYGYGIPDRVKRRGIKKYKIVLQDDKYRPNIADFLLYPSHINLSKKRLGVVLKNRKSLVIKKVKKGSLADKAGLKKGDRILKIDNNRVKSLEDLKLELVFVKDCVILEILRDKKRIKKEICFKLVKRNQDGV